MMKSLPFILLLWSLPAMASAGKTPGEPAVPVSLSDSTEGVMMRRFGTILRIKTDRVPASFVRDSIVEIYGYIDKDLPEDMEPGWHYLGTASVAKYEAPTLVLIIQKEEPLPSVGGVKHPTYMADLRVKLIKP